MLYDISASRWQHYHVNLFLNVPKCYHFIVMVDMHTAFKDIHKQVQSVGCNILEKEKN